MNFIISVLGQMLGFLTGILLVVGVFAILILALNANAQTPTPQPNVDLKRSGSTYPVYCQAAEPLGEIQMMCAVRTDLEGDPIELGCVDHFTLDAATIEVSVARTQGVDGEIRCYAIDDEGNTTLYSDNFGRADFTPPGRPWVKE